MLSLQSCSDGGYFFEMKEPSGHAAEYLMESGNGAGQWTGRLAEQLGLAGQAVTAETFNQLGTMLQKPGNQDKLPEGMREDTLEQENAQRIGLNITYSAPKSVSIMQQVCGHTKLFDLHIQAMDEANKFVEDNLTWTRAGHGGHEKVQASGAAFANFHHQLTRAGDPGLHTHSVLMNAVIRGSDGEFRALDQREIFRHQMAAGMVYTAALGRLLQEAGYTIRQIDKYGNFEIAGVPKEVIEAFSTRSKQMGLALEKARAQYPNASEAEIKDIVAKHTRADKKYWAADELIKKWQKQMAEIGWDSARLQAEVESQMRPIGTLLHRQEVATLVRESVGHLTAQNSIFTETNLQGAALRLSMARASAHYKVATTAEIKTQIQAMIKSGELVNLSGDRPMMSTAEMVKLEAGIIEHMRAQQGKHEPIAHPGQIDQAISQYEAKSGHALTDGQRAAVNHILKTRDGQIGIQGDAGSGKTTAMEIIRGVAEAEGMTVRGLGPTGKAALALGETMGSGQTIDSFLLAHDRGKLQGIVKGKELWVVDENSMTGSRMLDRLNKAASEHGARVVLVGDTKQLAAVSAGQIFQDLQNSGMATIRMDESIRQTNPDYRKGVRMLSKLPDLIPLAQDALRLEPQYRSQAANGYIEQVEATKTWVLEHTSEYANERRMIEGIRETYAERTAGGEKEYLGTLIVAETNAERTILNDHIRRDLQEAGIVGTENITYSTLESKGLSAAQIRMVYAYTVGDVISMPAEAAKAAGLPEAKQYTVVGSDGPANKLYVETDYKPGMVGQRYELDLNNAKAAGQIIAYEKTSTTLSVGDKVHTYKNDRRLGAMNGDAWVVSKIEGDNVTLRNGDRFAIIDMSQYNYIGHGYASTVHKSQGLTCADILYAVKNGGYNAAYTAITRGKEYVRVFTTNAGKFIKSLYNFEGKGSTIGRAILSGEKYRPKLAESKPEQSGHKTGRGGHAPSAAPTWSVPKSARGASYTESLDDFRQGERFYARGNEGPAKSIAGAFFKHVAQDGGGGGDRSLFAQADFAAEKLSVKGNEVNAWKAAAEYRLGKLAEAEGENEAARDHFRAAAKPAIATASPGSAPMLYDLGQRQFAAANYATAQNCFVAAAGQGHKPSAEALRAGGDILRSAGQDKQAFYWHKAAAANGSTIPATEYRSKNAQNDGKSWHVQAADNGHVGGLEALKAGGDKLYAEGKYWHAAQWYAAAAERGYEPAQEALQAQGDKLYAEGNAKGAFAFRKAIEAAGAEYKPSAESLKAGAVKLRAAGNKGAYYWEKEAREAQAAPEKPEKVKAIPELKTAPEIPGMADWSREHVSSPESLRTTAPMRIEIAEHAVARGEYITAEQSLRAALENPQELIADAERKGLAAYKAGDLAEAERWWRYAELGESAQDPYAEGLIAEKLNDYSKAAVHYQAARADGDPRAEHALGRLAAREPDPVALETDYFNGGHKPAGPNPTGLLQYGGPVAEPPNEQLRIAELANLGAAYKGDIKAQLRIGVEYAQAGDLAEAERWFRPLAEKGEAGAQHNMGALRVLQGDKQAAAEYYTQAAMQGYSDSAYAAGILYQRQAAQVDYTREGGQIRSSGHQKAETYAAARECFLQAADPDGKIIAEQYGKDCTLSDQDRGDFRAAIQGNWGRAFQATKEPDYLAAREKSPEKAAPAQGKSAEGKKEAWQDKSIRGIGKKVASWGSMAKEVIDAMREQRELNKHWQQATPELAADTGIFVRGEIKNLTGKKPGKDTLESKQGNILSVVRGGESHWTDALYDNRGKAIMPADRARGKDTGPERSAAANGTYTSELHVEQTRHTWTGKDITTERHVEGGQILDSRTEQSRRAITDRPTYTSVSVSGDKIVASKIDFKIDYSKSLSSASGKLSYKAGSMQRDEFRASKVKEYLQDMVDKHGGDKAVEKHAVKAFGHLEKLQSGKKYKDYEKMRSAIKKAEKAVEKAKEQESFRRLAKVREAEQQREQGIKDRINDRQKAIDEHRKNREGQEKAAQEQAKEQNQDQGKNKARAQEKAKPQEQAKAPEKVQSQEKAKGSLAGLKQRLDSGKKAAQENAQEQGKQDPGRGQARGEGRQEKPQEKAQEKNQGRGGGMGR